MVFHAISSSSGMFCSTFVPRVVPRFFPFSRRHLLSLPRPGPNQEPTLLENAGDFESFYRSYQAPFSFEFATACEIRQMRSVIWAHLLPPSPSQRILPQVVVGASFFRRLKFKTTQKFPLLLLIADIYGHSLPFVLLSRTSSPQ
jgi:hypothetical protein